MKRLVAIIFAFVIFILGFSSLESIINEIEADIRTCKQNGCIHEYVVAKTIEPTCKTIGTTFYECTKCGKTKEKMLSESHIWVEATCATPAICEMCGETKGEPLGHSIVAGKCSRCGESIQESVEGASSLSVAIDGKAYDEYPAIHSIENVSSELKLIGSYDGSKLKKNHPDAIDWESYFTYTYYVSSAEKGQGTVQKYVNYLEQKGYSKIDNNSTSQLTISYGNTRYEIIVFSAVQVASEFSLIGGTRGNSNQYNIVQVQITEFWE